MSDLKKEAVSLHRAASALGNVERHTTKPLHDFKEASHDLSALGALGSLIGAADKIRDGMETLAKITHAVDEEWQAEVKLLGDVSDAFDLLDILLSAAARARKS
ncbi:hypothetical protein OG285_04555 [Streptomyces sp. NBC_01471]|uniref:hypothetical protein n=1 Tax=Streptomyces sp. NBC_01471 TaxID=2903879 RepID=UPI00324C1E13